MTTFLFTAVAVSGIRILATCEFSRRNRFIMTCALSVGFGAILVPNWFSYFFTYSGPNKALAGFLDAITLLMEAGYALAGVISLILHLILPEESEKGELMTEGAVSSGDRDVESGITTSADVGMGRKSSLGSEENKLAGTSKLE
jgi:uric acid-xanthine permease